MRSLVLVGPTGVGKTGLSLKIAGEYFKNTFEIISADSVQVYKYLNIGSGKLSKEERKGIKHYLIDECDPKYHFTANDFCVKAKEICENIEQKGLVPFFIGGTGLYLDAFFGGLSKVPDIDPAVRESLVKKIDNGSLENLYKEFLECDPVAAKKVHPNDKQRIIRGLEVYLGTGKPITYYRGKKKGNESEKTLYIGLKQDSDKLYTSINKRVDNMVKDGLVEEVKSLKNKGYLKTDKALNSIGYAEIYDFLENNISLEDAILKIKKETRKYAKRQMIWFKRNKQINWFYIEEQEKIKELIVSWLKI